MINEQSMKMRDGQNQHACCTKCLSWRAILAGALVGIGLSFLLNLFSVAIGLTAVTTNSQSGMATLAIGGFLGMVIGGIASMFASGWVAGYLGRAYCGNRHLGFLYGFVTWCLALVITILLTAHASRFIQMNYRGLANSNMAFVQMTTDDSQPLVSQQPRTNSSATSNNASANVTVNPQKAVSALGISLFLTFLLFLLGAIASCLGGYFGLKSKDSI